MVAYGLADINGTVFPVRYDPALKAHWFLSIVPGLLLIILVIGSVFETAQSKALEELSDKNILLTDQKKIINTQREKLEKQVKEIKALNEQLEIKVLDRTRMLQEANNRLFEYANTNAHEVRGPLARILGLTYLSKKSDFADAKDIMEKIELSALELDKTIKKLGKLLAKEN